MLTVERKHDEIRLVLAPDRSMSWRQNQWVIASLAVLCLGIGIMMTTIVGAWVILPFAGLEILLVGSALYHVSWKLSYRQVLTIANDTITVEKGTYRPRGRWDFLCQDTRMQVRAPTHEWEAPALALICRDQRLDVGGFLAATDQRELIAILAEHLQSASPTSQGTS